MTSDYDRYASEDDTYVMAICHKPPLDDPNSKEWFFRKDEIFTSSERSKPFIEYIGKPVCIEHDKTRVVGRVDELFMSSKGDLMCGLRIYKKAPEGAQAIMDIKNGVWRDVSIGRRADIDVETYNGTNITPTEISLVAEGAIENSHIMHFNIGDIVYEVTSVTNQFRDNISRLESQQINNNMEVTPLASTQKPAAVAVAAPAAAVPAAAAGAVTTPTDPFLAEFGMTKEAIKAMAEREKAQKEAKIAEVKKKVDDKNGLTPWLTNLYEQGVITHTEMMTTAKVLEENTKTADGLVAVDVMASASQNHATVVAAQKKALEEKAALEEKVKTLEAQVQAQSKHALVSSDERFIPIASTIANTVKRPATETIDVGASAKQPRTIVDSFRFSLQESMRAAESIPLNPEKDA